MGRDVAASRQDRRIQAEAERRARETAATALQAAKVKSAEAIAQSNLLPAEQEVLFQRLDQATTLDQARNELVNASKLPARIVSNQERDDYSRQQFGGRTYGQLTSPEQAQVNAQVLKDKANWTIQATEQGIYRINPRTGQTLPVAPTSEGVAPQGGGASVPTTPRGAISIEMGRKYLPDTQNLSDDQVATLLEKPENYQAVRSKMTPSERQAVDATLPGAAPAAPAPSSGAPTPPQAKPLPFAQLSPFARELSDPRAAEPIFGAKTPTEGQASAQGFGSMALQAHEIVRDLERQKEFGSDFWLNTRTMLGQLSPGETLGLVGGVAGAGAGVGALGGPVGAAVGGAVGGLGALAVRLSAPALNYFNSPAQQAYMQAKLNFMTATLRKRSGAAISVGEFQNEDKRYFPQPGDSPEVIANKTRAREQEIRSLQVEAGRKLLPPQVVPFQGAPTAPQGQGAATAPDVTTGMLRLGQEALKRQLGGSAQQAPAPPQQVLPVSPQAQQQTAPKTPPKATLPVDTLGHLMSLKNLKSEDIIRGAADESLRAIGAETLTQQLSHYGPAESRYSVTHEAIRDTIVLAIQ